MEYKEVCSPKLFSMLRVLLLYFNTFITDYLHNFIMLHALQACLLEVGKPRLKTSELVVGHLKMSTSEGVVKKCRTNI